VWQRGPYAFSLEPGCPLPPEARGETVKDGAALLTAALWDKPRYSAGKRILARAEAMIAISALLGRQI